MATIHALGPFRLDADAEILFRGSDPLPVGKRAVALLRVLVERAGAPVSKDTLIDAAWPGLAVEESNLTVQIAALRRALGEVPGGADWIVTLPRRGYRFVGPVGTEVQKSTMEAPPQVGAAPEVAPTPHNDTERRQITAVSCELTGNARRADGMDLEDWREAVGAFQRCVSETITRHNGFIASYLGNTVLVLFGYPAAHEHDAERAVRAALELCAAVRTLRPVIDAPMRCRVGVATGMAIVGDIAEGRARDPEIVGDTPDLAVRLQTSAHPGMVAIDRATLQLVGNLFDCRDLDAIETDGSTEPMRRWQVLAERIVESQFKELHEQVQSEGLKKTFAALRTLTTAPGNLPAQATSFLGRDKDLAEVGALLAGARLITLTGVGGVGKTRLALHLAAEVCQTYPDGVWLVEFAAVGDPRAAAPVLAGVLGITQQPGKTIEQSLVNSLAGRRLLLILDNCEHLIDVIAGLAQEILAGCPQVSLLATSREALRVDGERSWPVPSLSLRDGITSPAVGLFVERARSVEPHFDLGADGDTVFEICRRLDGIPLAIELAAARIRAMSASQIRDRLHERFRLLTGGSRRAQERHQTLRHAVEWSYDLLSPVERTVLSRASVFAGGFTLEAAERVCGGGEIATSEILDMLDSLVRKSLVTVDRSDTAVRYGLLETIRQFAEEQLAAMNESEAARVRHAQFFAEDAEAHYEIYWGPRQLAVYQWLDQELDNLRSAFRWASDHEDVDIAARIASSIGLIARCRMHEEVATWTLEIVDAAQRVGHRRLGVLFHMASDSARNLGHLKQAKLYGEQAIALAGAADFDQFVSVFVCVAQVALYEGDAGRAIELARAGAAHAADRRYRACLAFLPFYLNLGGAGDEARAIADEVVAKVKFAGVPTWLIVALAAKGGVFLKSDPARALEALEQSVTIARETGNRLWEMFFVPSLAAAQARSGDPATALHSFLQMLDSWRRSTDITLVSGGIGALVLLFDRLGDARAVATISGFLVTMFESSAPYPSLPERIARAREVLGDAPFDEANKRGAAMTYREVVDYAADRVQHALNALGVGVTTG